MIRTAAQSLLLIANLLLPLALQRQIARRALTKNPRLRRDFRSPKWNDVESFPERHREDLETS